MDEPLPRSESVTPESSAGGSPPENSNSSETSSGVHSNSSASQHSAKRSNSVDDLPMELTDRIQPSPWRSFSLQRGTQPPTSGIYGFTSMPPAPTITTIPETTVVIRRKQTRPKTTDLTQTNEPFERSTNMRMTSFTDQPDGTRKPDSECPYPTRQQLGFCNSFPRTMQYQVSEIPQDGSRTLPTHTENLIRINENPYTMQPSLCHSFPRHTTIPTHHNGVRLFPQPAHTFAKRPIVHTRLQQDVGAHHTFPHVAAVKYNPIPNPTHQLVARQDRDSANYSMASSGDSDSYLQHS